MLQLMKFSLFLCVLFIFMSGSVFVSAQGRGLDPKIFKNQKALSESDIDAVIKVETQAKADSDLDEAKYKALIKSTGLSEDRYNYVSLKLNLGLLVVTGQASRNDLLEHIEPRESIPTEAEQRLINKRSSALLKAFDMD